MDSRQCPAHVGDEVLARRAVVVVAQNLAGDRLALDRLEHHERGTVGLSLGGEEFGYGHTRHGSRPHDVGLDQHVTLIARPLTLDDRRPAVREEPPRLPRGAARQPVQVGDRSTVEYRRQRLTESGGVHRRRITDRRAPNRIGQIDMSRRVRHLVTCQSRGDADEFAAALLDLVVEHPLQHGTGEEPTAVVQAHRQSRRR